MKILVIGAGIGGLAAALGLSNAGHHVRVVEQAPRLRTGGAAVTVWPNGSAVLRAFGAPIDHLGRRIDGMEVRGPDGRPMMRMDTVAVGRSFGAAPTICAPRRALAEHLTGALADGTVTYDARCQRVADVGDHVEATFADGHVETADVVIGADGRGSAVRGRLWPEPETHATGWVTWQGIGPVDVDLTEGFGIASLLGPEGLVGLQPAGEGNLQWYFSVPPVGGAAREPGADGPHAMLRELFGGYPEPVPLVLDRIADVEIAPWSHHTLTPRTTWGHGRITLLGDAAHAMPPSVGQGVNQTLEDAHALVGALDGLDGDASVLEPALRTYEARRTHQLRRLVKMAAAEGITTHNSTAQIVRRMMPRGFNTFLYRRLLEQSSSVLGDRRRAGAR